MDIRRSGAVASRNSAWCSSSVQPPSVSIRLVIALCTASTAWCACSQAASTSAWLSGTSIAGHSVMRRSLHLTPRHFHTQAFRMETLIAVTGATGAQGGALAHLLLDRGLPVRALTRNPAHAGELRARGAELAFADFNDPTSLHAALTG